MKNLKYTLFTAALSVAMTASFSSCSDSFLDEKNKSSYTTDYFKTSQGIQDLATALYGNIRWHFGYEWAYGITLYGTDEFTNGSDLTAEPWNTYDSRLNPLDCTKANGAANNNCPGISALWDQMYYASLLPIKLSHQLTMLLMRKSVKNAWVKLISYVDITTIVFSHNMVVWFCKPKLLKVWSEPLLALLQKKH